MFIECKNFTHVLAPNYKPYFVLFCFVFKGAPFMNKYASLKSALLSKLQVY